LAKKDAIVIKRQLANFLPRAWVRKIRYRRTELFLISYPKSGRTWLRLLLGYAISTHFNLQVDNLLGLSQLAKLHPAIPRILVNHDDNPHMKELEALDWDKRPYRHGKVIFLARDPRDILISLYFHKSRRDHAFAGTLSQFIDAPIGGFNNILRFYQIWAQNMHIPKGFHLIRYEDLHKAPETELQKLFAFMGLKDIQPETIAEAITFAQFDKMQKMEKQGQFQESNRLLPGDAADIDSFKARRGKVGGYIDYLSAAEINDLNERMHQYLPPVFNYTP